MTPDGRHQPIESVFVLVADVTRATTIRDMLVNIGTHVAVFHRVPDATVAGGPDADVAARPFDVALIDVTVDRAADYFHRFLAPAGTRGVALIAGSSHHPSKGFHSHLPLDATDVDIFTALARASHAR